MTWRPTTSGVIQDFKGQLRQTWQNSFGRTELRRVETPPNDIYPILGHRWHINIARDINEVQPCGKTNCLVCGKNHLGTHTIMGE